MAASAKYRQGLAWAVSIGLVMTVLSLRGTLSRLEWRAYDAQLSARAPGVSGREIIIVMIDDGCLDRLGPWPWPMSRHAALVRRLAQARPKAIVFDILFFGQPRGRSAEFAEALRAAGNVYLAVCFLEGERPLRLGRYGVRMSQLRGPTQQVEAAAAGVGAVNVFPEPDGVVRAAPLVLEHAGRPFPSLALQVVRGIGGGSRLQVAGGSRARVLLGDSPVPVNEAGEMLISYTGGYKVFPCVSYDEVLKGEAPLERFRNRIVLVGFSATGLSDTRPTPLSPACPGVEINAHIVQSLLGRDFIIPLGGMGNALLVLGLAVALGVALSRLRPFGALVAGPGAAVAVVAVGIYLFQFHGLWINIVTPSLTALMVGLVIAGHGYRASEHDKIRLESSLGALALATRMIAVSTSRRPLLDSIRQEITELAAAGQTDIYLVDEEAQELVLADGGREVRSPLGAGDLGRVARQGVPLLVPDANADPALSAEVGRAADFVAGPVALIPLRRHNEVVGVAQVVRRPGQEPFGERDLEVLNALSQEAAVALENAELYEKLEGKVELANRELVKAYSQLALEKDRVEALLENMTDAVIMTDTQCQVRYVNPAAERMFGVAAGEVVGHAVSERFDVGCLPALIARACRPPGNLVSEQVVIEEPQRMVLTANSALVADDQGQPVGVVTVLSDVTLLQELSDMKTEFVSMVSHELRTPLTSIQGFAQTLRYDVDGHFDQDARAEFLEIIEGECQRLLTMINELLDASRIEAGRALALNWGQVSIPEILDKVVKLQAAAATRHEFALDLTPDFPLIEADRDRIEQVLTNIVSNAIKYSPDGGTVRISGRRRNGEVLVSVADEGLGMNEAQLGLLFQRYQRAESDASRRIRGTGLGLYLTRGLVEAHGGRIWAESAGPGKGSTFSFLLPIKRVEEKPEKPEAQGGAG
jgi:PAS domain S-box-containing protein